MKAKLSMIAAALTGLAAVGGVQAAAGPGTSTNTGLVPLQGFADMTDAQGKRTVGSTALQERTIVAGNSSSNSSSNGSSNSSSNGSSNSSSNSSSNGSSNSSSNGSSNSSSNSNSNSSSNSSSRGSSNSSSNRSSRN